MAMFAFVCLAVCLGFSFDEWVAAHGKQFGAVERLRRKVVFAQHARLVKGVNAQGAVQLSLRGPFAGYTQAEFLAVQNGVLPTSRDKRGTQDAQESVACPLQEFPAFEWSKDECTWTNKGAVTKPEDQFTCAGCYAFAAVAALESAVLIDKDSFILDSLLDSLLQASALTNATLDLSEQQAIDCLDNTRGCGGGSVDSVLDYSKLKGIGLEQDYPFHSVSVKCRTETQRLRFNKNVVTCTLDDVPKSLDPEASFHYRLNRTLHALANQPIVATIDVAFPQFQLYQSGIYDIKLCGRAYEPKHAVLVVAARRVGDDVIFTIKNSWGKTWGQDGFMDVRITPDSHCGLIDHIYVPWIEHSPGCWK